MKRDIGEVPWQAQIVRLVRSYPVGTQFTFDKVRADATLKRIPPPDKPNRWGKAMQAAASDGLIRRTKQFVPSDIPSNHGRMMAVWERTE